MEFIYDFSKILLATCRDVLPIIILIVSFQLLVLRQPIPHLRRLIVGGVYVVLGLALFLAALEKALFPLGKIMAIQLSDPAFVYGVGEIVTQADWKAYGWVYLFAAMIGFATTIAEPSLIAVAFKASEVSAGTIKQWGVKDHCCHRGRVWHKPWNISYYHWHPALCIYSGGLYDCYCPDHICPQKHHCSGL